MITIVEQGEQLKVAREGFPPTVLSLMDSKILRALLDKAFVHRGRPAERPVCTYEDMWRHRFPSAPEVMSKHDFRALQKAVQRLNKKLKVIENSRGLGYRLHPDWHVQQRDDGFSLTSTDELLSRVLTPPKPESQLRCSPSAPAPGPEKGVLTPEEVIEAVAAYCRRLPDTPDEGVLRLSWQGKAYPVAPALQRQWLHGLRQTLEVGWAVRDLWLITEDVSRTFFMITELLAWLGPHQRYEVRVLPHRQPPRPVWDVFVLGADRALVLLATRDLAQVDRGLWLADPDQVQACREHFDRLWEESRPLLSFYRASVADEDREFVYQLRDAEAKPGERRYVAEDLSTLIYPPLQRFDWRTYWLGHRPPRARNEWEYTEEFLDIRLARGRNFLDQLGTHRHRDIISRDWLWRYAGGAYIPPYGAKHPPQLVVARLVWVIELLQRYPNYELALAAPGDIAGQQAAAWPWPYWQVKGDTVLFEVEPGYSCVCQDADIAAAFARYHDSLWERLPHEARTRKAVIEQLKSALELAQQTAGRGA